MKIRIVKPDAKEFNCSPCDCCGDTHKVYSRSDTIEIDIDEMAGNWIVSSLGWQSHRVWSHGVSFSQFIRETIDDK